MEILCFGDSNTWGHNPAGPSPRFTRQERWTGRLADSLGAGYHIYEEGLCGRTTVFEDPFDAGVCGKETLSVCLRTHMPVDLVVIMLGTNDLKHCFYASADEVSRGIERLIQIVQNPWSCWCTEKLPEILIISPILVGETITEGPFCEMFGGLRSREISLQLAPKIKQIAEQYHCHFLNAADYAAPSLEDAIHMDVEGHRQLAAAVRDKILEIEKICAESQSQ